MSRDILLCLVGCVLVAGTALAFLPSDASSREPEIRAYREKVRKEYEERIEKRREVATREFERATKSLGVPPWELDRVVNGDNSRQIATVAAQQVAASGAVKKQILVSIVLFILIGSGLVWVRKATRNAKD